CVEREERGGHFAAREVNLGERSGETEAVDEAEEEGEAPALSRVAQEDVLDANIRDRKRDGGVDEAGSRAHRAGEGRAAPDRMGDCERGDDGEELFRARADEDQAEEEDEVIVAGEDVLEPHFEKGEDLAERGRWACGGAGERQREVRMVSIDNLLARIWPSV